MPRGSLHKDKTLHSFFSINIKRMKSLWHQSIATSIFGWMVCYKVDKISHPRTQWHNLQLQTGVWTSDISCDCLMSRFLSWVSGGILDSDCNWHYLETDGCISHADFFFAFKKSQKNNIHASLIQWYIRKKMIVCIHVANKVAWRIFPIKLNGQRVFFDRKVWSYCNNIWRCC